MVNKILISSILGSLIVGTGAGYVLSPTEEVQVEVEKIVNKTVEVPVEVPVEVKVDNVNLSSVLEHIYDNDGRVQYLTNDLEADEVDEIVDRIVFINYVKSKAVSEIKSELFDELDREVVSRVELDEDEMERLRIDDDFDELDIIRVDFDEKDADVLVKGSFEQDEDEFTFRAIVEFKDGEVDEIKSIVVNKQ